MGHKALARLAYEGVLELKLLDYAYVESAAEEYVKLVELFRRTARKVDGQVVRAWYLYKVEGHAAAGLSALKLVNGLNQLAVVVNLD